LVAFSRDFYSTARIRHCITETTENSVLFRFLFTTYDAGPERQLERPFYEFDHALPEIEPEVNPK